MLAEALAYAAKMIRVFPCRGKVPNTRLVPRGYLDATTNPETIRRWWSIDPTANVGGVPGPRFLVVDVDGPKGEQLAISLGLFAEPTRTARSGRANGGRHLWFLHPGGEIGNKPLGPGLDIRADRGFVVMPPSIHPDTRKRYAWESLSPAIRTPPALFDALRRIQKPAAGNPVSTGPVILEGQRDTTLAKFAGALRRVGAAEPIILAALTGINQDCVRPPLAPNALSRIARSMTRYPALPGFPQPPKPFGRASVSRPWGRR